jgi:hypothetical protein
MACYVREYEVTHALSPRAVPPTLSQSYSLIEFQP